MKHLFGELHGSVAILAVLVTVAPQLLLYELQLKHLSDVGLATVVAPATVVVAAVEQVAAH